MTPLGSGARMARGDKFVAFGLVDDFGAALDRSINCDGIECASNCFALERVNQLIDDGLAVIVKDLAGSELLDVVKILGRGSGDDIIAGSDGELNGVAADACGPSPDEQSLAGWLWTH